MNEHALLNANGDIVNVVTTPRSIGETQSRYPAYTVLPLSAVPLAKKQAYGGWYGRPGYGD